MLGTERQERAVEIHTLHGAVQGRLLLGAQLRTLDDLNVVSKNLVTIHAPQAVGSANAYAEGPLAINKRWILFVRETTAIPTLKAGSFGDFSKAAVQLQIGTFNIQGFVHVPRGGNALKRFDQKGHPFLSLTSTLITGLSGELTAPFLAVNRSHIVTVQQTVVAELAGVPVAADVEG